MRLRDCRRDGSIREHGYVIARRRLERHATEEGAGRLDRLLDARPRDKACRTFRNHLHKHRDQRSTFLYEEDIEAGNWPAEQAIRPTVVNRKVFGGNRTRAGAHALEILASLFATCRQNGLDALDIFSQRLRHPTPHALPNPTAGS